MRGRAPGRRRHRGAGVDDVVERGVVTGHGVGVLDEHLQDGRDGEHVGDAFTLDQGPDLGRVEAGDVGRTEGAPRATCGSRWTPAPCESGATTSEASRRWSRHQVGEVVGDHEAHLVVGQDGGLRAAARAGGEEVPGGIASRRPRPAPVAGTVERGDLADRIVPLPAIHRVPPRKVSTASATAATWSRWLSWQNISTGRQTSAITDDVGGVSRQLVGARIAPTRQMANMAWMSSGWLGLSSRTQSPAARPVR